MMIFTLASSLLLLAFGSLLGQPPPQSQSAPHDQTRGFVQQLQSLGESYLGVGLLEVNEARAANLGMDEVYGVEISGLVPGSPAEHAGIKSGDIVLTYAGKQVMGVKHFVRLVKETPIGRKTELKVLRGGAKLAFQVTTGKRNNLPPRQSWFCDEDDPSCEFRVPGTNWRWHGFGFDLPRPLIVMKNHFLGVEVESLEGQLAEFFGVEKGLLVRYVGPSTPGERADLKAGDIIISLNGKPVANSGELNEAIRHADRENRIILGVVRNRTKVELQIEPHTHNSKRSASKGYRYRFFEKSCWLEVCQLIKVSFS